MDLFSQIAGTITTYLLLSMMLGVFVMIASKIKSGIGCVFLIMLTYGVFGIANMLYMWHVSAPQSNSMTFFLFASIPIFIAGRIHGKKFPAVSPKPADDVTTEPASNDAST